MNQNLLLKENLILPADIVLAPQWWFHNHDITFDEDFFFNPKKRVESERQMENILYEKWGRFGLGTNKDKNLPQIGPVHLAAGFLLSEMLGCKVVYSIDKPPQVIPLKMQNLDLSSADPFNSPAFKKFTKLIDSLKNTYGYLIGDINFAGILNIALDLRGETFFMDIIDKPDQAGKFLADIAEVIEKFTDFVQKNTGSTSISVNRNVRHFKNPVFLHSECSHTMIATQTYEKFLLPFDEKWSRKRRPFGIHFCGKDPHRYAKTFTKLPHLDFLDVGWPGDVKTLRKYLPQTFLNIRLSPVEIINQTPEQIENTITTLLADSAKPELTGICCINMDQNVTDDKITAIFQTVQNLRNTLTGSEL